MTSGQNRWVNTLSRMSQWIWRHLRMYWSWQMSISEGSRGRRLHRGKARCTVYEVSLHFVTKSEWRSDVWPFFNTLTTLSVILLSFYWFSTSWFQHSLPKKQVSNCLDADSHNSVQLLKAAANQEGNGKRRSIILLLSFFLLLSTSLQNDTISDILVLVIDQVQPSSIVDSPHLPNNTQDSLSPS